VRGLDSYVRRVRRPESGHRPAESANPRGPAWLVSPRQPGAPTLRAGAGSRVFL